MPIFDSSVLISAPRVAVLQGVKTSFDSRDTLIVLREAPIVIGLGRELGYVYCVGADTAGMTQLRLIVDRASHVRDAFRSGSPRVALEMLARTSRGSDPRQREIAVAAFAALQARITAAEAAPLPAAVTQRAPLARLFSRPRLRGAGE